MARYVNTNTNVVRASSNHLVLIIQVFSFDGHLGRKLGLTYLILELKIFLDVWDIYVHITRLW